MGLKSIVSSPRFEMKFEISRSSDLKVKWMKYPTSYDEFVNVSRNSSNLKKFLAQAIVPPSMQKVSKTSLRIEGKKSSKLNR